MLESCVTIFAQTVGLSIGFSIGLAAYLGFFYTPLHTVRTIDNRERLKQERKYTQRVGKHENTDVDSEPKQAEDLLESTLL